MEREQRTWFVIDDGKVVESTGSKTDVDGYWWFASLGFSACEGYQLFATKEEAVTKAVQQLRAASDLAGKKLAALGVDVPTSRLEDLARALKKVLDPESLARLTEVCRTALSGEPTRYETFQQRVRNWVVAAFGETIANDLGERTHRFLEEALELVQAAGCTKSEALQLVDYVYSRPAGTVSQETGGTMTTLASLCYVLGVNMEGCGENELCSNWKRIEEIREKQAKKPKNSPLPSAPEGRSFLHAADCPVNRGTAHAVCTCPVSAEEDLARSDYRAHLSVSFTVDLSASSPADAATAARGMAAEVFQRNFRRAEGVVIGNNGVRPLDAKR